MNRNRRVPRRQGSVLIYSTVLMVILLGMVSLGMDYAHCQSVKTELQRSAGRAWPRHSGFFIMLRRAR